MGSIADLAETLRGLLEAEFSPAEVGLSVRDGIVIILVSTRFEGMDDMDRQEVVWDFLTKHLAPEQRRSVSIVVASTPEENTFHLAGKID